MRQRGKSIEYIIRKVIFFIEEKAKTLLRPRIRKAPLKMKKKLKSICITCILCIATVLSGCSSSSSDSNNDTNVTSKDVQIGGSLTVRNTDTRLKLISNLDTLSADGLYYASWAAGSPEPYENFAGDTVDLYDAQLYLLLGEFKSSDAAQQNMDNWFTAGQTNYNITAEENVTCNGQSYTVVTYTFDNEENPYERGVSAFGVHQNLAVCVELTCRENYQEDLYEMLVAFLNNCTYK